MINSIDGWSCIPDEVSRLSAEDRLLLSIRENDDRIDINTVRVFLEKSLPSSGQPTYEQLRDVVEVLGHPEILLPVIDSILADKDQLDALPSYGHSTGMDRIELANYCDNTLRLHFWMFGDGDAFTEDPHSHVYRFGSKVLSGVLVTDLFEHSEEGDIGMYQIASQTTVAKPEPELLRLAGLQVLTPPQGIVLTPQHNAYTMSHIPIHRVRKGDPTMPVITLNMRGTPVIDTSIFYRDESMFRPTSSLVHVDKEARLELLRLILSERN